MATQNKKSRSSKTPSQILRKWYKGNLLKPSPGTSLAVFAFMLVFGAAGVVVYQASHAAGQTELKSGLGNFCVSTNYSDGAHNGDPVNLAGCSGVNGQNWSFTGGQITFHDPNGGTGCAQPYAGNFNEQIHMVMATCSSSATQGWTHESWNGIEAPKRSHSTGHTLCLTVPGGNTAGTPQLEIRDCNNTNADQKWTNQSAPPPPSSGGNCANPIKAGPDTAKCWAKVILANHHQSDQFTCMDNVFSRESGWRWNAANASGAYGIPQALPGSKMSSFGSDWATSVETQIKWGLSYMNGRYGSPCGAWHFWQNNGWYGIVQNPDGTSTTW